MYKSTLSSRLKTLQQREGAMLQGKKDGKKKEEKGGKKGSLVPDDLTGRHPRPAHGVDHRKCVCGRCAPHGRPVILCIRWHDSQFYLRTYTIKDNHDELRLVCYCLQVTMPVTVSVSDMVASAGN